MSNSVNGVHLWLILIKAFHAVAGCAARDLRKSGLGDTDFRVLEALLHKGRMPVNAIGPKVFLTSGSISTAVERLCARGLVSRTEDETDRRVHMVDLTPKGRASIVPVFREHGRQMEDLVGVLTPAERDLLAAALKKLGKHAAARCQE